MRAIRMAAAMAAACVAFVAGAAQAQSVEEFYKGKRLRLIVGGSAGGGYDTYARAFARHYVRYIPGHPFDHRAGHAGGGRHARDQLRRERRRAQGRLGVRLDAAHRRHGAAARPQGRRQVRRDQAQLDRQPRQRDLDLRVLAHEPGEDLQGYPRPRADRGRIERQRHGNLSRPCSTTCSARSSRSWSATWRSASTSPWSAARWPGAAPGRGPRS